MCSLCSVVGRDLHSLADGIGASSKPGTTHVSATGRAEIDGLLTSWKWTDTSLTYSFPSQKSDIYWFNTWSSRASASFEEFNDTQKAFLRQSLEIYSDVSGLSFTEMNDSYSSNGTLRFWESNDAGTAYAFNPSASYWGYGGDAVFNHNAHNNPQLGTYAGMTAMHEIGHALGLSHGHESSPIINVGGEFGTLDYAKDSHEYSLMTYKSFVGSDARGVANASGSYSTTLMQSDIAAIQHMYGANYNHNSGDTTYTWNSSTGMMSVNGTAEVGAATANKIFMTLWDGGGTDTYDLSNYSSNLTIDLRPGEGSTFSTSQLAQLGGWSYPSQIASSNVYNSLLYNNNTSSLIENTIGGTGNDTLTGNSANNTLNGGTGADTMTGGTGNDTYVVDNNSDTVTESWGEGTDTVQTTLTNYTLGSNVENLTYTGSSSFTGTGNSSANTLTGGSGADTLTGGAGDDTLKGQGGADTLTGGAGTDTLSYSASSAAVTVNMATSWASGGDSTGDSFSGFENVTGSSNADHLIGDHSANTITGGAGNDRLEGNGGADTLTGGAGDDTLKGQGGNDTLIGEGGNDLFVFDDGNGDDIINDFVINTDDIDFSDLSTLNNYSDVTSNAVQSGSNTVIDTGSDNSVTLLGVDLSLLDQDDFVF